jgi:heme exporter protein B
MNHTAQRLAAFRSLVHKDLTRELRAPRTWAAMLLLGLVLVALLEVQAVLPPHEKQQIIGGLLWLAIFFAGTLAVEHSFAGERSDGCWRTLRLYPLAPGVLFLAKLCVNFVSLVLLECVLVPTFVVLSDVPLLSHPARLLMIIILGNLGFAAVGTLASALTAGVSRRGGLLSLLVLPLAAPVILGAAESTRLLMTGGLDATWQRWIHLLAVFAALFTVMGTILFEFVIED